MMSYLQDTTPLLNDWSAISTASGVYTKKIITKDKKFWQIWVDLMIHPDTSINQFLSGFIFSLLWCWDLESDRSKEGYLSALG